MGNPALEIIIIFLLLLVNGVFAMSEIAIVSSRKARLQQRAQDGDQRAKQALELATSPNQFLSTVQIGITLVGILAGAFGGATIAEELEDALKKISILAPYSEALSVAVVVLGITYFSLIIGELVPKRLALNNAEGIAAMIAAPMRTLSAIFSPVVRALSASTDIVIRLLGIKPSGEPPVTEEEVRVMIAQGTQVGVFEEAEQDMIEGVLRLGERLVGALMTPRTQIVWIDPDDPVEEIKQIVVASEHARFPLAHQNLDNIQGIVQAKDILLQSCNSLAFDWKAIQSEPLFLLEKMPALQALELLKQSGTHLALVVDEYGGVEGLITHNDIVEDIIGSMPFLGAVPEPRVVCREDGSYLADGLLRFDKFIEIMNIKESPDEEEGDYQTLGGFVISQLGMIPSAGQWFDWGDYRFEVVDMDWRRVDKVLVTRR